VRVVAPWALLVAALLAFLVFGDVPERTLFWNELFDAGHTPLFGLLALAALQLLRAHRPGMSPGGLWGSAFGLTLALGVVTELLQTFQSNREPSLEDLARDLAGVAAFLLVAASVPRLARGATWVTTRRRRLAAVAVAVILLAVSGLQAAAACAALTERRAAMPTLVRFDGAWWERHFIRPGASRLTPGARPPCPRDGYSEPLARLDLQPGLYPGISIDEPYPDWRGYRRLVFTVVSDLDEPFRITIRVHDSRHDQRYEDRFNRTLTIAPGVNRFAIRIDDIRAAPDRREMDMSRIRGVVVFAYRLAAATHVFLGPLRLE
jgi:hypothetical protein